RAALALGPTARTLVLTKDAISESATRYAQGGIAVALGEDDDVELHEQDTLLAGDGLCSPTAVRVLVEEGPKAIEELLAWGADFDRESGPRRGALQRTREAAHSRARILHAHGDSTGREIAETLARQAEQMPRLQWAAHRLAVGLQQREGRVTGVLHRDQSGGPAVVTATRAVLLATGGLGQLYRDTTNPPVATGDGVALALQAGATLADMEFVQFHPTALALAGAPRFLLSEALRGEGAILRNPAGERFMLRYHAAAEMAPRDVVARALDSELQRRGAEAPSTCFLDATALGEQVGLRFPRICATLSGFGFNLAKDWIPVRPAAHYAMGGILTSLEGRSTLPGLFAAGECACTGVHGANRLASNSLLEGLVFGARAGGAMADEPATAPATEAPAALLAGELNPIRAVLTEGTGLVRTREGLEQAQARLQQLPASLARTAATAIIESALARPESRGAHYRSDFPGHDSGLAGRHSLLRRGHAVRFAPLP
ncbi:MAG: L-aspartate oxidase, partial [Terriglobales bacterium]